MATEASRPQGRHRARSRRQCRVQRHRDPQRARLRWRSRAGDPGADAGRFHEPAEGANPMSAMSIRLPESLHRNARAYAAQEGVSVNQLIAPRWRRSWRRWRRRTIRRPVLRGAPGRSSSVRWTTCPTPSLRRATSVDRACHSNTLGRSRPPYTTRSIRTLSSTTRNSTAYCPTQPIRACSPISGRSR